MKRARTNYSIQKEETSAVIRLADTTSALQIAYSKLCCVAEAIMERYS